MRRFEQIEGNAGTFWEVAVEGDTLAIRRGRLGTNGRTRRRACASGEEALAEAERVARELLAGGFVEVAPPASAPAPAPAPEPEPVPAPEPSPPWEGQDRVVWTAASRAWVHPRRDGTAAAPEIPDRAALHARLCAAYAERRELWQRGFDHADEDCADLMRAVDASLSSPAPPSEPPDVQLEAARAVMLGPLPLGPSTVVEDTLIDAWVAAGGCAFAVEALARSWTFAPARNTQASVARRTGAFWLRARRADTVIYEPALVPPWGALRGHLASTSDADYAAARAAAARLRERAPAPLRCLLAYAFAGETDWTAEDVAACLESARVSRHYPEYGECLLASLADAALAGTVARVLVDEPGETRAAGCAPLAASLVDGLGPAALGPLRTLLQSLLAKPAFVAARRHYAEAVARIQSPEAASLLVVYLEDRDLREIVARYFRAVPELGISELSAVVVSENKLLAKLAGAASRLLGELVREHPAAVDAVLPALGRAERRAVQGLRSAGHVAVREAQPSELPRVLAAPPWLGRPAGPEARVEHLPTLEWPEAVAWREGERERFLRRGWPYVHAPRAPSAEHDARLRALLAEARDEATALVPGLLLEMTEAEALRVWNDAPASRWVTGTGGPSALLARFGTACLPGVLAFAARAPTEAMEALARVRSPRVALLAAGVYARVRRGRPAAEAWLLEFPEEAAAGLTPAALGGDGRAREAAVVALAMLKSRGHGAALLAVASRYGPRAAAALERVLADDPLLSCPIKPRKMPEFWDLAALPRPLLRGRAAALPVTAVEHLGTMLAASAQEPYPGLAQVKEACDPASLEEFAWALFSAWLLAGAPPREDWAFVALAWIGGDEAVRRLAPLVRAWPGESAHARAVKGLEVLARMGTDLALMHVHQIAEASRHEGLRQAAADAVGEFAAARGLSPDEVADRLVPDLGLGPDGSRVLDFGGRRFHVGFDEQLRPFVRDEAGARLTELPRPHKGDDARRAHEAAAVWKALKRDVRGLAAAQVRRCEAAMCARRRWDAAAFATYVAGHPLLGHLARRLLWGVYEGAALLGAFRVAEDGSLADAGDAPFALPPDARVGVVHRLDLDAAAAAAWGRLFADYEIVQPFEQLAREVFVATDAERAATALDRVCGLQVHFGSLLALDDRGWRRGAAEDAGVVCTYLRPVPGSSARVVLRFEPGMQLGALTGAGPQGLGRVTLEAGEHPLAFGALDAVAFSELRRDLDWLARQAGLDGA